MAWSGSGGGLAEHWMFYFLQDLKTESTSRFNVAQVHNTHAVYVSDYSLDMLIMSVATCTLAVQFVRERI